MSRTYRNRHSVPKGLKVRDGDSGVYDSHNNLYYLDTHNHTEVIVRYYWARTFSGYGSYHSNFLEKWKEKILKGTERIYVRRYIKAFRRSYYSKDSKEDRHFNYKRYRAMCRKLMSNQQWDDLHDSIKTSGWLTW